MNTKTFDRFAKPTRLTDTTKVLGATAKQWDEALTGDMINSLKIVKKRVLDAKKLGDVATIEIQGLESGDLASAVKHRKTRISG